MTIRQDKLTKREYTAQRAELEKTLKDLISEEEKYSAEHQNDISSEVGNYWNGLHDKIWFAETAIRDLNSRWEKRLWNSQDYQMAELVFHNCD